MSQKKQRIWELDALRGICIIGMILVHLFFDLQFFGGMEINLPDWFIFVCSYGHVLFVLLSGICVTFSSKSTNSLKRGTIVFFAGLLVSYVTFYMDIVLQMGDIRIWFGVLHMLGVCMMLYPLFRKLPWWLLVPIGAGFVVLGFWMEGVRVGVDYLFPIGLRSGSFYTGSDYFPIFPGLGWFLLGTGLGKTLYRKKESLLPKVDSEFWLLRFFRFIGRHSLEAYLLHQPVLSLAVLLLTA